MIGRFFWRNFWSRLPDLVSEEHHLRGFSLAASRAALSPARPLHDTTHTPTHTPTDPHTDTQAQSVYQKHSEVCDALLPTYAVADGWRHLVWTGWWKRRGAGGNKKSRLTILHFGPQLIQRDVFGMKLSAVRCWQILSVWVIANQSWRTAFTLLNQLHQPVAAG